MSLFRLVAIAIALVALLVPASALADSTIQLTDSGFSAASVVVKPGESVTFDNTSLVENVQFEDEGAPRCAAPLPTDCTRAFPDPGEFTFYDQAHGCGSYNACPEAYRGLITVADAPTVSSITGSAAGERGKPLTFDGAASDPNGEALTFHWDWGDGQADSRAPGPIDHVYGAAGHYTVTLTASDPDGTPSGNSKSIEVDIAIPDRDGDAVDDDLDKCPDLAAATADGCPPPPPIITPPVIARFDTAAVAASTLGQSGVLKSGVTLVLNCSDACNAVVTLLRGTTPVGAKTVAIPGAGSRLVTIPVNASARRSLAKAKSPKLRLQVAVTDPRGVTRTLTRTIQLRAVQRVGALPALGISDQQPQTFSDPFFQILQLRYARLVTPWNSIFTEKERLDQWLQAARAAGIAPLVSFHHRRGEVCPKKPCTAPSAGQYRRAWKAFHKKYPWVKDISPWNEVNSETQPTGKRPQLAALYYNIVRASCRGCRVVAADLLDTNNLRRYVVAFLARAKGKPRIWGLHNYRDTNRFRETGTRTLIRLVKGDIWLTETGGIVRFETAGGKLALPQSEKRAKKAMDYMFRLAQKYASRVKRIYVYQWRINNPRDRFDAGVVRADGSPRPSFQVLTLNASVARKR